MLTLLQATFFLTAIEATAPTSEAPVSALHAVQLAAVAPEAKAALEQFARQQHWKDRIQAAEQLRNSGGDAAILVAELARSTADRELLQDCYSFLMHERFVTHPATRELVLTQGLNSENSEVRYRSVWYVGQHQLTERREELLRLMRDRNADDTLRYTAAKSLGELGDLRSLRLLLEACRHNRFMPRHLGNIGLKAIAGKNLNDFSGYQYHEDAFVSGGREMVFLNPDPLVAVTTEASRLTALRDFLAWLQSNRRDLYETLMTDF